ncbi:MAG: ATP-dependent DNA helicase RecG [Fimbriimonadaceae bacterium]|jgi:ATP-dependent DNA helicase RecG|nr:ATP-dependent DNA helicase RecG [Fimbriimonadaceae bacterium]
MSENGNGLEMEIQYLKGVGPKTAMLLAKLKLQTVRDVLYYFPRRYDDRRNLPKLIMLRSGEPQTVRGRLIKLDSRGTKGGKVLLRATLDDSTGQVSLVWFNQPWLKRELEKARGEIIAYGLVREGPGRQLEISSPEWEWLDEEDDSDDFARITPVYPLTEGVPQWAIRRAAKSACQFFASQVVDPLPNDFRQHYKLPSLAWSVQQLHSPENEDSRRSAHRRLAFEEFLYLQLTLQIRRNQVKQEIGIAFPISQLDSLDVAPISLFAPQDQASTTLWEQVHKMLPFQLTQAQERVIGEIWDDMERPAPMNRLVQGDVGSGKTAVAACAMLAAVRCGYQAALMAPTEILAEQHYANLHRLFEPLGITVRLLVGKQGAKEKRAAMEAASSGQAQLCVGTHALIQEGVQFHKLGLAIIDEQHRFGVVQRLALRQKGIGNPDVLVMTATPIPRTLTMTLYGDLDLSVIDELPPGRKPIKTHWKLPSERPQVYKVVADLVAEGRQAYFVCPMITESDKMQTQAAEDLHYRLSTEIYPHLRIGLLHGQMKSLEKEAVMNAFRAHELDILVSTVVIEVGVDVPNATIMVIEDAFRFGLSQLHQLRGRVGRGSHQSFCILISESKTEESNQRMKVMVRTSNGFEIAEEDLKLRGPGDLAGTRQSGIVDFNVANLIDDGALLEPARQAAIQILTDDPGLSLPRHSLILEEIRKKRGDEAMIVVS